MADTVSFKRLGRWNRSIYRFEDATIFRVSTPLPVDIRAPLNPSYYRLTPLNLDANNLSESLSITVSSNVSRCLRRSRELSSDRDC
jgi:hypothetical protein